MQRMPWLHCQMPGRKKDDEAGDRCADRELGRLPPWWARQTVEWLLRGDGVEFRSQQGCVQMCLPATGCSRGSRGLAHVGHGQGRFRGHGKQVLGAEGSSSEKEDSLGLQMFFPKSA